MTTPTIEQIYRHGSVRDYLDDPVPRETVETIVAAAQRSATSSNLQTYSVVAVMDAERRARLAELCGNQAHIAKAPVFLAWCADLSRLDRVCQRRGYTQRSDLTESFLVSAMDVAIAMQTATLAAESLGLGTCYIGAIRNNPAQVIQMLGLPRLTFPLCGMTIGWPVKPPSLRPRLPLQAVLHWETYDISEEEQLLAEYDRTMIETGIYSGRQVPVSGVEGEMEEYGWQEHSARRVSEPHRAFLRDALKAQGLDLA